MPMDQSFHKPQEDRQGSESFQVGGHVEIQGEWLTQRAWKVPGPARIPCPTHLFPMAVPGLYPLTIN